MNLSGTGGTGVIFSSRAKSKNEGQGACNRATGIGVLMNFFKDKLRKILPMACWRLCGRMIRVLCRHKKDKKAAHKFMKKGYAPVWGA